MARRQAQPAPFELLLVTKTPNGNVSYTTLAKTANKTEAWTMYRGMEAKLAAQLPENRAEADGWVAIYLQEDGDMDEKGRAFTGTKALAKRILGGRVRTNGPAPRAARGRAPARGRAAALAVPAPVQGVPARQRFAVLVETAKGTAKTVARVAYAATEDAAVAAAKRLLERIERDVRKYGEHRKAAKVRVEVIHTPTQQITARTHWVQT